MAATESFGWLHLTDLHYGVASQGPLWPNVRAAFFADLRVLHERSGPWQAVLFTGDLVQSGQPEEFEAMEIEVLERLREQLEAIGSGGAMLLAVPGNHDLLRPAGGRATAAGRRLLHAGGFAEVEDQFWSDPDGKYRRVVGAALANYQFWWERASMRPAAVLPGLLPGDFSATLQVGSRSVGIVGLNTTFLQLAGGAYQGRLAWDLRQLQTVCGGDAAEWCDRHDACLLLTHQGRDWLDKRSREAYPEINPAGRFAAHLFGHMHETVMRSTSLGGGKPLREWQACSLFGLEKFGEPPQVKRRHGYGAGRIEFGARQATIRQFPRRAVRDANGWRFIPDQDSCLLMDDAGTAPEPIGAAPAMQRSGHHAGMRAASDSDADAAEAALVAAFTSAARTHWDILDFAGLPENERHVRMQPFALWQLYLPLRLEHEQSNEEFLAALREHGKFLRLSSARRATAAAEKDFGRAPWNVVRKSLGSWLKSSLASGPAAGGGKAPVLGGAPRLIILGDPGGGKTTLLRWLATACLMRVAGDPDLARLPDAETLPAASWLPVLIRCRELNRAGLGQINLEELLRRTVASMELPGRSGEAIVGLLRARMESGLAILLFDGLDEISDPVLRAAFCERIEGIAATFPRAPIIATSRIVGYREMRRRLGRAFAHATLAALTREEKDEFIGRWCEVTIVDPARRTGEEEKVRQAIRGSDRIERLTTNPMLLTTMALVQRRLGKLPTRRHKLYWEAVNVLLNWRTEVEDPMDLDEVLPQLEYLAYCMCERGAHRLRRDEVLSLLEAMRRDYPNFRLVQRQTPEQFLAQLERRTGLFVQVGEVTHDGRPTPVYEFQHLTFQEYLAALAILAAHFPVHQPGMTLAERIQPLASKLAADEGTGRTEMPGNWRETLRLCVASCNDEDVDGALAAILAVHHPEEEQPRAILAMLCLCDEPEVGQEKALEILRRFAAQVEGDTHLRSVMERAVDEAAATVWAAPLKLALAAEFLRRGLWRCWELYDLCGRLGVGTANEGEAGLRSWSRTQVEGLASEVDAECVAAVLSIARVASHREGDPLDPAPFADRLLQLLNHGPAMSHAACRTLRLLCESSTREVVWRASPSQEAAVKAYLSSRNAVWPVLCELLEVVKQTRMLGALGDCNNLLRHAEVRVREAAVEALGGVPSTAARRSLREALRNPDAKVRSAAAKALGALLDAAASAGLQEALRDPEPDVRCAAAEALGKLRSASAGLSLREALRDPVMRVRHYAAIALWQLGGPSAQEALREMLRQPEPALRVYFVMRLGDMAGPAEADGLREALRHSDEQVRCAAARGLRKMAWSATVEEVLRLALRDVAKDVRRAALFSLVSCTKRRIDQALLSQDLWDFSDEPGLDPQEMISHERVGEVAKELLWSEEKVRHRYETLATRYGLRLEWRSRISCSLRPITPRSTGASTRSPEASKNQRLVGAPWCLAGRPGVWADGPHLDHGRAQEELAAAYEEAGRACQPPAC